MVQTSKGGALIGRGCGDPGGSACYNEPKVTFVLMRERDEDVLGIGLEASRS